MSSYHYFAYGIYIRSEIRCSSLAEYSPEPGLKPDVHIHLGKTPDALEHATARGVLYTANVNEYLLKIPSVANFYVHHANQIIVEFAGKSRESEVALFLLAAPLAALLHQRGQFVLHASAVKTRTGAVAFAGSSGVGKSAVAIALASRGYPVITDELCVVGTDTNNNPCLWPGTAESLIWRDTLKLMGTAPSDCVKARPGLEKYAYRHSPNINCQEAIALQRIYILSVTNTPTPSINKVRGVSKVNILLQQQYNHKLVADLQLKHAAFSLAAKLSSSLDMHDVSHPRTIDSLASTVEKISLDIEAIQLTTVTATAMPPYLLPGHSKNNEITSPDKVKHAHAQTTETTGAADNTENADNTDNTDNADNAETTQPNSSKKTTNKNIIWMASYPKSGNTWLRAFLANYVNDCEEPIEINKLANDRATGLIASQRKIFDDFTGVEASNFTHTEIATLRTKVYSLVSEQHAKHSTDALFIKIHDAFYRSPISQQPIIPECCTRGVIYVVRNPLDVAISNAHHFELSIEESIQALNNEEYCIGANNNGLSTQLQQVLTSWSGHYKSWVENQQHPILVVRFEDMHNNPTDTFKKIVEFSGLEFDSLKFDRAIQNSSFKVLKKQETASSFGENPSKSPFFRRGASGGWKEVLSVSQVNLLRAKHGRTMEELGYSIE